MRMQCFAGGCEAVPESETESSSWGVFMRSLEEGTAVRGAELQKFRLVTRLGELILLSGGEIFRAEEAMRYAAAAYGLQEFHAYVIANGIFASCETDGKLSACRILSVPLRSVVMNRVEALNALSRRISAGSCPPEEAEAELERIAHMPAVSPGKKLIAAAIAAGSFSCLVGGSLPDGLCAAAAGFLLECFLHYGAPRLRLSKIMSNIAGAALTAFICSLMHVLGLGQGLDRMIIGPLFLLTPGVPLTNAIRNFMENDYLSGLLRLMDALLVAGSIAVGVGFSLLLWQQLSGSTGMLF